MDLTPSVYGAMRGRAAQMLSRWRHFTDDPQLSSVVDRTYLKMMQVDGNPIESRDHFLATWTHAMRSVLVDMARRRRAQKRGQEEQRVPLHTDLAEAPNDDLDQIIDIHRVLETIEESEPRDARIIALRFYGGCSWEEIAEVVGGGTARELSNEWRAIRANLIRLMPAAYRA